VGVDALAAAKRRGAPVTGAVALAHLLFNEVDMGGLDTRFRLDPPLRPEADRQALIEPSRTACWTSWSPATARCRPRASTCPTRGRPGRGDAARLAPALLNLHHADGPTADLLRAVTANPARLLGLPRAASRRRAPPTCCCSIPDAPVVMPALGSPFDGRRLQGAC
jgi:dihydroorotase